VTVSPSRRRPPADARAVGLLGGLLAALASAGLAYEAIAWILTTREWTASDTVAERLVGVLGFFTLGAAAIAVLFAAVLFALGLTAMVDAARSCRGDAAGRLWLFFALPAGIGLATMMTGPTVDEVQVWLVTVAVAVTNFIAWRKCRRAPADE